MLAENHVLNGPDAMDLIWGAEDIGQVIKRSTRQVNHLLSTGALPGARKMGGRWCISRRALIAAFEDTPLQAKG